MLWEKHVQDSCLLRTRNLGDSGRDGRNWPQECSLPIYCWMRDFNKTQAKWSKPSAVEASWSSWSIWSFECYCCYFVIPFWITWIKWSVQKPHHLYISGFSRRRRFHFGGNVGEWGAAKHWAVARHVFGRCWCRHWSIQENTNTVDRQNPAPVDRANMGKFMII